MIDLKRIDWYNAAKWSFFAGFILLITFLILPVHIVLILFAIWIVISGGLGYLSEHYRKKLE